MTLIFAHRGSAGTQPENTMESFRAAEKAGADGIELDVHLTADGNIAVIHDTTVDRTTDGTGKVHELNTEQLKRLKANYHFKHFLKKPSAIPMLDEVFDWLRGNRLLCNIEIKNNHYPYEGLEEKIIGLIKSYQFEDRIIISSFNHYSLVYVHQLYPEIPTAPLYRDGLFKPWEYAKSLSATAIHPKLKAVTDSVIRSTIANGIEVRPYTVNKEKDIKRLLSINCSALITDYPEKAVKLRNRLLKN